MPEASVSGADKKNYCMTLPLPIYKTDFSTEKPLDAHTIHLIGEIHCHMAITAIKQIML